MVSLTTRTGSQFHIGRILFVSIHSTYYPIFLHRYSGLDALPQFSVIYRTHQYGSGLRDLCSLARCCSGVSEVDL